MKLKKTNDDEGENDWSRGSEKDVGVYTDAKCKLLGHGLIRFTADDDDFGCDNCGDSITKGTYAYGCDKCDWDMCSKCEEKKQKEIDLKHSPHTDLKCSKGHNFIQFETRSPHSTCSICNTAIPQATYLLNCWRCNINMCLSCEEKRHSMENGSKAKINQKNAPNEKKVRGSKDAVGVHTNMKCDKNHGLVRHMVHDNTTSCSVCKKKVDSGTFIVGCDLCNWDMCFKCEEAKQKQQNNEGEHTSMVDKNGHPLVQYTARMKIQCDECKQFLGNGSKMFCCNTCMYDVCAGCEEKIISAKKIEEKENKKKAG